METYGEDGQGYLWPSSCRKGVGKEEAAGDLAAPGQPRTQAQGKRNQASAKEGPG